jgi:hypothetical protein
MKINYQLMLDATLNELKAEGRVPRLLLHSCCGPCSTYVLEYLADYFDIGVLYYNPNIYPEDELKHRLREQIKVIDNMPFKHSVKLIECSNEHSEFTDRVKGLEAEPEGGARCEVCFRLRLEMAAEAARLLNYDYFTTTLTVSPHKNSQLINSLGCEYEEKYGIKYLCSDFKKREGYKRSIELSKQYELYRQDYCGCEFSIWR